MSALLGVQTAAGVVLAVFTALFATSLARTMAAVTSMPADRLVAVRVDAAPTPASAERVAQAVRGAVDESDGRLVAMSALPLLPAPGRTVTLPGRRDSALVPVRVLTPGAFAMLGQRLVHGRDFAAADAAEAATVAIVSETLARRVSGGEAAAALGASLRVDGPGGPRLLQIVGVAADVRAGLTSRPGPELYVPFAPASGLVAATFYVVGPAHDAATLRPRVVRTVRAIDAETPVGEPVRVDQLLRDRLVLPRFRTTLLSSFGALALVLACAGVFAVALYTVARRSRELAVRVALGADRRALTRALAPVVAVPVGSGVVVGLAVAAWLAPLVRSMLIYEVSPTAPGVHATAAVVFLLAACAATVVPLVRAWRLDPAAILRCE